MDCMVAFCGSNLFGLGEMRRGDLKVISCELYEIVQNCDIIELTHELFSLNSGTAK